MTFALYVIDFYLHNLSSLQLLLLQIVAGAVVYLLGAWIFRVEAFREFMCVIRGVLKR
jgi:hypothetical protein